MNSRSRIRNPLRASLILLPAPLLSAGLAHADGLYVGVAAGQSRYAVSAEGQWGGAPLAALAATQNPGTALVFIAPAVFRPVPGLTIPPFGTAPVVLVPESYSVSRGGGSHELKLGYRFNKYLAAEASFIDLGQAVVRTRFRAPVVPPPLISGPLNDEATIRARGLLAAAVATWPLSARLELRVRLGAMRTTVKATTRLDAVAAQAYRSETNATDLSFGAGAAWQATPRFSLALGYSNVKSLGSGFRLGAAGQQGEDDASALTLGLEYQLGGDSR